MDEDSREITRPVCIAHVWWATGKERVGPSRGATRLAEWKCLQCGRQLWTAMAGANLVKPSDPDAITFDEDPVQGEDA